MRSLHPRHPFSEVRSAERQVTLFVLATSAVAACGTLVAGMLIALGAGA
jgi:hypothetical protein